jgi:hypothetical protein
VSNEPLYSRSKTRTMTRGLSACLSTLRILAGIKVIWWPLSTSEFGGFGIYLQDSDGLNLASFYQILPYFSHRTALASRYSKGMVLPKHGFSHLRSFRSDGRMKRSSPGDQPPCSEAYSRCSTLGSITGLDRRLPVCGEQVRSPKESPLSVTLNEIRSLEFG